MSIKTERLANLLVNEISSILMTEIKDEDIKTNSKFIDETKK